MTRKKYDSSELLEVAAHIRCPIRCTPYCPQDRVIWSYGDNPLVLSLKNYKNLLSTVPESVVIAHAGLSEPFMNPDVVDMALYTDKKGHKQMFFTTLFNAEPQQIKMLSQIDWAKFLVHMPDGIHAKIPYSRKWAESLHAVATLIPSASYMSMNNNFKFVEKEHLDGNGGNQFRRWGFCRKLRVPQMFVYPNGDVHPCCMLYDSHLMGNLYEEPYQTIRMRLRAAGTFRECHYCNYYMSLTRFLANKAANYVRSHAKNWQ